MIVHEQLFLHDKVLSFLYKLCNLPRNEDFAGWFRLHPLLVVTTVMLANLSVRSSSFQNFMNDRLIGCITYIT